MSTVPAQLLAATGATPSTAPLLSTATQISGTTVQTSIPTAGGYVLPLDSTQHSKGLSTAAQAGIGAGAAIVGLTITVILIYLIVKHVKHRQRLLRLQNLRRDSERGMRNAAAFQSALPPAFLENEDTTGPPKPPPKPPKPVVKASAKSGCSWMNEKEVVVDWRTHRLKGFSLLRDKSSTQDFDSSLKKGGYSLDSQDSWV
jgi:hypothetical protein